MNTWRRTAASALVLLLLLTLSSPAWAAQSSEVASAQTLYGLGLFQGTAAGRFDETSMALDRSASRAEALAMFLRLLGRESSVQSGGWSHPFTDVPDWAASYVGHAYTSGLAKGTGGDLFQSGRVITLSEYTTLLLRAAGYDESAGDFSWQTAVDKALALELYDSLFVARCQYGMTRGQMAEVSLSALSLPAKGGAETLAGMLARLGAVDGAALTAQGIFLKPVDKTTLAIQSVTALVNEARAANGLEPLSLDAGLSACATVRAQEIGQQFSHIRPSGQKFYTVLDESLLSYRAAAENIAMGHSSARQVVDAWLSSPGHRANILSPNYTRIGVGLIGRQWVQLFTG